MEEGPLPMTTESTAGPVAVEELEPLPETAVETQPVAARPAPPPINIPRINVEITSLQAFQPIEAQEATLVGLPGQSFSGTLSSGIGFAMQVDFELAEPATGTIVDPQITHYAQVFAQDSSTGRKFHLGDSRPASFINSESRYVARLTNMKLDSGTYDLNIFVAVQGGRQIADHARVSLLVSDN